MINILWVDPVLFKWTGPYLHPHMFPHIPRVFSFFLHPRTDKKNWQKLLTALGGKISNLFALDYTIKASINWLYYKRTQQILNEFELIITFIFFQACERAESSKSCNLIRSESGWYFTILSTNPGGIIGCFIFLLTLVLLLASAKERWLLLFGQKIWSAGKPLK